MEKKNTILLTVIAVATLLVAVIGATFAYFSAKVTENNKTQTVIKAAQLGIIFTGTDEIDDDAIEPGWSDVKVFTVENTSNYDMTFDVNFTKVVNNFSRTEDLTYTLTASYLSGAPASDSNVKLVTSGDGVASSEKANLNAYATVTGKTMPVDGSVLYQCATEEECVAKNGEGNTTIQAADVITPGTNVTKIARVFIPANSKIEFNLRVDYANLTETSQNVDQGKYFRTTIAIEANGIDAGTAVTE